jgi:hypothetical protein
VYEKDLNSPYLPDSFLRISRDFNSFLQIMELVNKSSQFRFVIRKLIPSEAYQRVVGVGRWTRNLGWSLRSAWKYRHPDKLMCFGIAPGDDLLCTAVLRELAKRGRKKIWMMSNHPDLFLGNSDVDKVVPVVHRFKHLEKSLGTKWQLLNYTSAYDPEKDMNAPPKRHIIAELCLVSGIQGQIALRPYFYLTIDEREKWKRMKGTIAIQSSGLGAKLAMRNKQWFPERFQEVIDSFKWKVKFVQIGSTNDPLLNGVVDFRGKTNIRESASILANSLLFVGNAGFLMHLARAVECPSVIVYGGREAPWQSGYSCNINLYSDIACSPCWQWNRCDYDRICMKNISVNDVVQAIEEAMIRPGDQLTVDNFEITDSIHA